jgi:hypothetical protein
MYPQPAVSKAKAVAHALVRAAPAFMPTHGFPCAGTCREESRHGTHECVRHLGRQNLAWLFRDKFLV